jgi:hypothetical protein
MNIGNLSQRRGLRSDGPPATLSHLTFLTHRARTRVEVLVGPQNHDNRMVLGSAT